MKKLLKLTVFSFLLAPAFVYGFDLANSNFKGVISELTGIINLINPILVGLAFLAFFWGLSRFILNSNKPDEIKDGKKYMIWGIVALFVLLTYRAIVSLISAELEIGDSKNPPFLPEVPYTGGRVIDNKGEVTP